MQCCITPPLSPLHFFSTSMPSYLSYHPRVRDTLTVLILLKERQQHRYNKIDIKMPIFPIFDYIPPSYSYTLFIHILYSSICVVCIFLSSCLRIVCVCVFVSLSWKILVFVIFRFIFVNLYYVWFSPTDNTCNGQYFYFLLPFFQSLKFTMVSVQKSEENKSMGFCGFLSFNRLYEVHTDYKGQTHKNRLV